MQLFRLLFLILFIITVHSCAGDSLLPVKGPEGDPSTELSLAEFDDLPIPLNSKLDKKESIIFSKKDGWLGRLTFNTSEKQIDVLISLGGDGTNRMIAKGFDKHTVLPVSTGTNNVFPYDLEGTHIGICAGLIASQAVDKKDCTVQSKQIVVTLENGDKDLALVDLAISTANFVASRAIWDFNNLDEVFLTRCELLDLGLASVGARLQTIGIEDEQGLMYKIAKASEVSKKVLAPIGPGTIQEVLISDWGLINRGQVITRNISRCTLAFDGEREIQITNEQNIQIELIRKGPFIVDVSACLEHAAQQGDFYLE